MSPSSVVLAATMGDPASIGPEVSCGALEEFFKSGNSAGVRVELFCDEEVFQAIASAKLKEICQRGDLQIRDEAPENLRGGFEPGKPSHRSAARALSDLQNATEACITRRCAALVTGPVDKHLCAEVQPDFRGHTEFLQKQTGASGTTMLLASEELRVALVTTHLAVRDISAALSKEKIVATVKRTADFLREYLKRNPKLAVCALNPHASDQGLFGDEEAKIIEPACRSLQGEAFSVSGPYPADTLFFKAGEFDAIVCMYHDQGLIPLKMRHFYDAVNITLGLPFLRTSVDHGTAFDIAGQGKGSHQSYANAIRYAEQFVRNASPSARFSSDRSAGSARA